VSKKALVFSSVLGLWGSEGWAAGGQDLFTPLSMGAEEAGCSVCLSSSFEASGVPPFRAGPRDTASLGLAAQWSPHSMVRVRTQVERLRMQWPSGDTASGWGDVRLGTTGVLWRGAKGKPEIGLDWSMKLPNASDEGELGSDESDAEVGLFGRAGVGPWRFGLSASLLILGDPLQFANQDDALVMGASISFGEGRLSGMSRVRWREESPRNPRDIRWLTGARLKELPGGLWVAAEGGVGFTMAAPTWQAGVLLGVSRACRASNRD
jgi:hypothetical protein